MVVHSHEEEGEWRTPQAALALDLSLVEDIFWRLARQRRDATSLKSKDPHNLSNNDNPPNHSDQSRIQTQVLKGDEAPQPPPPTDGSFFHPDLLFSKSDVLVTLEKSQGFLQKRPMLRMLHTSLACVSLEKEGASVEGFVRFRVKERTLSFAMARDRLVRIFHKTQSAKDFEAQVQLFKEQARAKSLWCVRDWKSRCTKPSQYYGVHVIPIKLKTQKQLDEEQKILETVAAGVVNNVLQLSIEKIVDQVVAARRPMSGGAKRSGRGRTPHFASQEDGETGSGVSRHGRRTGGGASSKLALRTKAKRGQEETEARRKQLRLQILAPNVEQTSLLLLTPGSCAAREAAKLRQQQSQLENTNDGDEHDDGQEEDGILPTGLEDHSDGSPKKIKSQARSKRLLLLLLATVEANGDVRIAECLVTQKIAKSGFQRALDQAKNLGLAKDDHWGLVKIWKTVYRSHTMQSLQSLLAK